MADPSSDTQSSSDQSSSDGAASSSAAPDAASASATDSSAAPDATSDGGAAQSSSSSADTGSESSGSADSSSSDSSSDALSSDGSSFDDAASGNGASSDGAASDTSSDASSDTSGAPSAAASSTDGATAAPADPGPPYLIADLYSGDHKMLTGGAPDWAALAAAPGWRGAILKAWEGLTFNDGGWLKKHWDAVKAAGGDAYGQSWFRGAYLFLIFARDGAAQADAYLAAIEAAGGWDKGDIHPIIDVELGHPAVTNPDGSVKQKAHPNQAASNAQIIKCATDAADRLREKTGRKVILYGRGAMRDRRITDRMGCDMVWNPSYTKTPHTAGLEGWNPGDAVLWQYRGTESDGPAPDVPHTIPGFGVCDMSVVQNAAGPVTLQYVRDTLLDAGD